MEQVLLWIALVVGVLLFCGRFVPLAASADDGEGVSVDAAPPVGATKSPLQTVALGLPFLGLLATLPAGFGPFHSGAKLGLGFLFGGIALLAANRVSRRSNGETAPFLRVAASYGASIAAVSLALLFLRASLYDALLGVALGGFSISFILFLDLPLAARVGETGKRLAVGAGFLGALCAGAGLMVFRDSVTTDLPKLSWAATLLAFAALGTLLAAGTSLLVRSPSGAGRLAPLALVTILGGIILALLSQKITNSSPLYITGIGGLLLWPVVLAVVQQEHGGLGSVNKELLRPALLIASLLVVSGFLAALQFLQGAGAAIAVVALFIAHLSTLSLLSYEQFEDLDERTEHETRNNATISGLLMLATLLLLWRFFVTRWAGDLRGVNLTDQYALFGLLVGAALPRLLSAVPQRYSVAGGKASAAWGSLVFCGAMALACPAAILVLFGAKSATALLLGLGIGLLPLAAQNTSLFPGFFALAIALVLAQFTGRIVPDDAPTRMEKIRVLLVIMAGVVVATLAARSLTRGAVDSDDERAQG